MADLNPKKWLLLLLSALGLYCVTKASNSERTTKLPGTRTINFLESLLRDYDKSVRPGEGGPPDIINVSLYVKRINYVSEATTDFSVDMYFRQEWRDPRLAFESENVTSTKTVRLDTIADRIWQPDTFFRNEVTSFVHGATVRNQFFRLSPDGCLQTSTRYTITINCPMNLRNFPMDTQVCSLDFESYGYTASELMYRWGWGTTGENKITSPGVTIGDGNLPNFKIDGWRKLDMSSSYGGPSFSYLKIDIQLSRHLGYYYISVYAPSASLVVVSFLAFWIDEDCIGERISLGVTTILTVTMLTTSVNANLPKIPYVKASDVYLGICFMFVLAALLLNITMGYVRKNGLHFIPKFVSKTCVKKVAEKSTNLKKNVFQDKVLHHLGDMKGLEGNGPPRSSFVERSDFWAKFLFPVVFIIVNLCYWGYYLQASRVDTPGLQTFANPD